MGKQQETTSGQPKDGDGILFMLDLMNKISYNNFSKEPKKPLRMERCSECGELRYIDYEYGRKHPFCKKCADEILN